MLAGSALIFVGWRMEIVDTGNCSRIESMFLAAGFINFALYCMSFFTFIPILENLALSPLLRIIHQVTGFVFVGDHPPPMLYVTDGGVNDCTGLLQLLWRRSERILLVLAAADPNDDLNVLRTAMRQAVDRGLATFYDPRDPRMSVDHLFTRFKNDKTEPYMHIGISYYHGLDGKGKLDKTGHLFIIKNRISSSTTGQPVMPLITAEEVRNGPFEVESSYGLNTDQLGPCACCDCCHQVCNCGPKFPHGNFLGYMCLSPMWFSSLARLGFSVSERAIFDVTSHNPLRAPWENKIISAPVQDKSLDESLTDVVRATLTRATIV